MVAPKGPGRETKVSALFAGLVPLAGPLHLPGPVTAGPGAATGA